MLTDVLPKGRHARLVLVPDRRVPLLVGHLAEVIHAVQAVPHVRDDKVRAAVFRDVPANALRLGFGERYVAPCSEAYESRRSECILPCEGRNSKEEKGGKGGREKLADELVPRSVEFSRRMPNVARAVPVQHELELTTLVDDDASGELCLVHANRSVSRCRFYSSLNIHQYYSPWH